MSGNNAQGVIPALRRNGKQPSCEPCRKSKYSCDHTTPVCVRCQRRGLTSKCVYHPSPMKGLSPRVQKNGNTQRLRPGLSERTGEKVASPKGSNNASATSSPRIAHAIEPGFIGSTGYNAVLAESGLDGQPDPDFGAEETTVALPTASQPGRLSEAVAVLELIADFPHISKIVNRWNAVHYVTLIVGFLATPITADIGRQLYEKGTWKSICSLKSTAQKLFSNTSRSVRVSKSCQFDTYYQNYTGDYLRWEALCVMFTTCGLACNSMSCEDPLFDFIGHRDEDRQNFMHRLMHASNTCLCFCEDAGQLSDLALWTLCDNSIYNSQVLGDAHYQTWRKVGDVSTAIFARGYHEESKDAAKLPFWMIEMRRRALGHAYSVDKVLCTFVGRPPRISKRYCSIQLPVDLEFEELALEGAELRVALSNLDENGWNVKFKGRKSTYRRICIQAAMLREEVLELSLGPPREDMLDNALDILGRNESLFQSLPDHARYDPSSDHWDMNTSWSAVEYLDLLYNEFMVRRTLARQIRYECSKLLNVAYKILSVMTKVCGFKSLRGTGGTGETCSVGWMAVLYGLPVSGVLALELLKQKTRVCGKALVFPVPKSQLIQDLVVFIANLKWVHAPCEGNYQLVEQARKTLQQILDRILADAPAATSSSAHTEKERERERERLAAAATALPSPGGDRNNDDTDPDMIGHSSGVGTQAHHADAAVDLDPADWELDFSWLDNAQFDADFWMNISENPLFS